MATIYELSILSDMSYEDVPNTNLGGYCASSEYLEQIRL